MSPTDIDEVKRIAVDAGMEDDKCLAATVRRIAYYHPESLAEFKAALQPLHPIDLAIIYGGDSVPLMCAIRASHERQ